MFSKVVLNLQHKQNEEEIINEVEKIMKDKKQFDEDPERQSAIFVKEYYSKEQQALRKTKSTFVGVFKRDQQIIKACIKEITFDEKEEKVVRENYFI